MTYCPVCRRAFIDLGSFQLHQEEALYNGDLEHSEIEVVRAEETVTLMTPLELETVKLGLLCYAHQSQTTMSRKRVQVVERLLTLLEKTECLP